MLRRPATQISLTADDIAAYEQNRQRRVWEQNTSAHDSYMTEASLSQSQLDGAADPSDELRSHAQEKSRAKAREDRIMGNSGRG
ncbi:hypothetical protein K490DRAFT_39873 [Saccharata proteae CBS 121410]|uniref:Anaphase-promoting complex, subunit CDC26 n=1 Tax=Saccharata proteae CBS 121410 TaxID=1314787 RepID=A0A9P4HUE5_9PEZI|nr:hypothetical protein K490DRAFT_39873 [Saccharata proteae CBS 121410]